MNKFKITSDIIEIETNKSIGRGKAIGARALFEGIVRNSNEGQEVIKLEYECYESLAIKEGNLILDIKPIIIHHFAPGINKIIYKFF